jgi:hypothetical protein
MVVIIWYLDLRLHMQSMHITTKVVSSNPVHGEVYSIQHYVIKFVSGVYAVNAPFNNISVISWQSVLLVEETRVPGENHRPVASH